MEDADLGGGVGGVGGGDYDTSGGAAAPHRAPAFPSESGPIR